MVALLAHNIPLWENGVNRMRFSSCHLFTWHSVSPAGVRHVAAVPPGGDGSGGPGPAAGHPAGLVDPLELPQLPWRRGVSVFDTWSTCSLSDTHTQ